MHRGDLLIDKINYFFYNLVGNLYQFSILDLVNVLLVVAVTQMKIHYALVRMGEVIRSLSKQPDIYRVGTLHRPSSLPPVES